MRTATTVVAVVGAALILALSLIMLPLMAATTATTAQARQVDGNIGQICSAGDAGSAQIPEEYREDIAKAAEASGTSQEVLASQIFQESNWIPSVVSSSGAKGLGQIKDGPWAQFGAGGDPFNGHDNIAAVARLHVHLKKDFAQYANGDDELLLRLTLAGYRVGPKHVHDARGMPTHMPAALSYTDEILARTSVYTTDCRPVIGRENITVSGEWTHPLPNSYLTSPFGYRGCVKNVGCADFIANHDALDFSTGQSSTVVAATAMTVTHISLNERTGIFVQGVQTASPGYQLLYLHCAPRSVRVKVGDVVQAGQPLCTEGETGYADGVHLHFAIGIPTGPGFKNVDPRPILEANGIDVCPPGRDFTDACRAN